MKKICFVATTTYALSVFVLKLAKRILETTDWQITFISVPDEAFAASLPEGIRYIPVNMGRGVSFDGLKVCAKLKKIFKQEKFDFVQYSTPNAACYASIAAKMAKVPVRIYCQWGMVYVGFSGVKRKIFKTIEKIICKCSTVIEPDSFGNRAFCISEGLYSAEKSRVIKNGSACGVPFDKFDASKKDVWRREIRALYGIPDNAYVYGFVGRITVDKGVNELFEAYRGIEKENENTYMILIGKKDKVETIVPELYEWAQTRPNVVFCGFQDHVEKYLAAMDVYILPSYREGFGMGVIEAEAMKVPAIVTDIPGPNEAVVENETGLFVPVKDAKALRYAMERLLKDREAGERMGERGREFVLENYEQNALFEAIIADRKELMKDGAESGA